MDASGLNNHHQEYKLRRSSLCNFLLSPIIFFFLVVETFLLIVLFSISVIKNEMQGKK